MLHSLNYLPQTHCLPAELLLSRFIGNYLAAIEAIISREGEREREEDLSLSLSVAKRNERIYSVVRLIRDAALLSFPSTAR